MPRYHNHPSIKQEYFQHQSNSKLALNVRREASFNYDSKSEIKYHDRHAIPTHGRLGYHSYRPYDRKPFKTIRGNYSGDRRLNGRSPSVSRERFPHQEGYQFSWQQQHWQRQAERDLGPDAHNDSSHGNRSPLRTSYTANSLPPLQERSQRNFTTAYIDGGHMNEDTDDDMMLLVRQRSGIDQRGRISGEFTYCSDRYLPLCRAIRKCMIGSGEGYADANSVEQAFNRDPYIYSKLDTDKFQAHVREAVRNGVAIRFIDSNKGKMFKIFFDISDDILTAASLGRDLENAPHIDPRHIPFLQAIHDKLGAQCFAICGDVEDLLLKKDNFYYAKQGVESLQAYVEQVKNETAPIDFYYSIKMGGEDRLWFCPSAAMPKLNAAIDLYQRAHNDSIASSSNVRLPISSAQSTIKEETIVGSLPSSVAKTSRASSLVRPDDAIMEEHAEKVIHRRQDTPPPDERLPSIKVKIEDEVVAGHFVKAARNVRFNSIVTFQEHRSSQSPVNDCTVKEEPGSYVAAQIACSLDPSREGPNHTDTPSHTRIQDTPEPEEEDFKPAGPPISVKTEIKEEDELEDETRTNTTQVAPLSKRKLKVFDMLMALFDHHQASGEYEISAATLANQLHTNIAKVKKMINSCNRGRYVNWVHFGWTEATTPGGCPIIRIIKHLNNREQIRHFVSDYYTTPT